MQSRRVVRSVHEGRLYLAPSGAIEHRAGAAAPDGTPPHTEDAPDFEATMGHIDEVLTQAGALALELTELQEAA